MKNLFCLAIATLCKDRLNINLHLTATASKALKNLNKIAKEKKLIQTYTQAHIHTHIPTHIHIYIHIYIQKHRSDHVSPAEVTLGDKVKNYFPYNHWMDIEKFHYKS